MGVSVFGYLAEQRSDAYYANGVPEASTLMEHQAMTWHEAIRARCPGPGRRGEVTRATGIDPGNLSRYLSTGQGLSVPALERLAVVLGLTLSPTEDVVVVPDVVEPMEAGHGYW